MVSFIDSIDKDRKRRLVLFISTFLFVVPSFVSAQSPVEQSWSTLQAGADDKSADQRIATMRVLQLIPGNAKAVTMAEKGLQDKEADVRGAAALSLGAMGSKSSIPALAAVAKADKEGAVVLAAAKALIQLGDERGYSVYYAVLTGQRKSGESLVGGEEKQLNDLLRNPKQMEEMAFEQGMGFVPFGGIGLQAFNTIHASETKGPILKATCVKILAKDPDARTEKALITATADKEWLVRAAAYDALARRGHAEVLPDLAAGLKDDREEVKLTAAAAIVHLSTMPMKSAN
jgi:HEAT repeat protein